MLSTDMELDFAKEAILAGFWGKINSQIDDLCEIFKLTWR